jgi:ferredoxin-NADP reductase
VQRETANVVSVTVKGHRLDRLRTQSGQFFIWRFLDDPGWTRCNPYTISRHPTTTPCASRSKPSARAANASRDSSPAPAWRSMPYGTMTAQRRLRPKMLVTAAGVGITPVRALIADTPYAPGDAALIYRDRNEEDAIFRDAPRAHRKLPWGLARLTPIRGVSGTR